MEAWPPSKMTSNLPKLGLISFLLLSRRQKTVCPKIPKIWDALLYMSTQYYLFSKTNHHLFSLQKCRLVLIRVMGDHLVKVLGLMRVMCGTRVTLLSFGTREYMDNIQRSSILSYRYRKYDTFSSKYRIGIVSVSKF